MKIGERMSQVRQQRQMSQEAVARALYVTRQTVSRWEQGHTLPNIYVLQDLCKLYGCSLEEFVGQSAPAPTHTEGDGKMSRHINWLALFGLIWFNIIVGFAAVVVVAALLFSLWTIVITLIASPGLAVGAYLVLGQAEQWWQFVFSFAGCMVGVALLRPTVSVSQYLWQVFIHYLRYNRRSVYSD